MEYILILKASPFMSLTNAGKIVQRIDGDAERFQTTEDAESVAAMYARNGVFVEVSEVEE